jgi:hypothetical protein
MRIRVILLALAGFALASCANDRNVVKTPVPPAPQRTN